MKTTPRSGVEVPETHAVTAVTFDQALACTELLGKRLPEEGRI